MPNYNDPLFITACQSLSRHRLIRAALRGEYGASTNSILRYLRDGDALPEHLAGAYDTIVDTLTNDSPVVKTFEAEQDKGVYHVTIRGFPGAYFVQANEYDDSEIFLSREAAIEHAHMNFGEFMK